MGENVAFYRDSYIEVYLDRLERNVQFIQSTLPSKIQIIAVVKADAYGHGAKHVAKFLASKGISFFAVATLDEAIELRRFGLTESILLLGPIRHRDLELASRYQLTISIFDLTWFETAIKQYHGPTIEVHLDLDTGMNRIGLKTENEVQAFLRLVQHQNQFRLTGIYSHLATSEEDNTEYYENQIRRFEIFLPFFDLTNLCIHIANSGAVFKSPPKFVTMVRIGLFLHGAMPNPAWRGIYPLEETMAVFSHIIQIKVCHKGEKISYNGTYTVQDEEEIIATLPIGYADGLDRRYRSGRVFVQGDYGEIIGRICMDLTMIKLKKMVPIGSKVEIIGSHVSIEDYAMNIQTSTYQAFSQWSDRLPRLYYYHQQQIAHINPRFSKEAPYE